MSQFRVSPPGIFPEATRSSRPPADAAGSADAHRQGGFILGGDIDLLVEALNMEGGIAAQARTAKYRNHVVASTLATWSRSWLLRLEALHALEWGNYTASVDLVASGARMLQGARQLLDSGAADWLAWLDAGGIATAPEEHGSELRFEAREPQAADPADAIDAVAAASNVVAAPAFAPTVLLAAPESTPGRVVSVFGDRDFHVALGELCLGWLLTLSRAWLDRLAADEVFPAADDATLARWRTAVDRSLARRDRCRVEPVGRDGRQRYIVSNWRRAPGAAPRRILL